MVILEKLKKYVPFNEQEENDINLITELISSDPDIFFRDSQAAHITVSAWVVNREMSRVLFAFHNIYNSWAWLGGHADGERNLPQVALREAEEESGISDAELLSEDIFSVEILPVSGHIKKGIYVPSHIHLNFTYLITADENSSIRIKEDENSNVGWLTFSEILEKSNEEWIKNTIYKKLIEKTERFYDSCNSQ